jgi:lysophospholipase L1-like esterase
MDDLRACFFGDSLTLGQGDDTGLGWPGRVFAAARADGHGLTLYNLGVRGQTGAQIAARAKVEADARLAFGSRKAVAFSFGTNDLLLGRPLDETLEALEALLDWAGAEDYAIFVLPPPTFVGGALVSKAHLMADAFADACERRGAPFLDTRTAGLDWLLWWSEARAGDGVHPGAQAYGALAQVFSAWPAWQAWLKGDGQ